MQNAFGQPQTILLLGGTSDIGVAIVRRLMSPVTRTVVLACRDTERGEQIARSLRDGQVQVAVEHFDGAAPDTHAALVDEVAERFGDVDVAILAFGQLGRPEEVHHDPAAAAALVQVNVAGAVSASLAVTNRMRAQGHGTLVVLSSVAGERVRKANFVYGSTKAGLDGFAQGLGDSLAGTGVRVMVVRPGFVHSAMTKGLPVVPFATTPDQVAAQTVRGLRTGRRTVWAPGVLRYVFSALRHVPGPIWRRLPLG